jgi:hypothetical protein
MTAGGCSVAAAINDALAELPVELRNNPTYKNSHPAEVPAVIIALNSDRLSAGELFEYASNVLQCSDRRVKGVLMPMPMIRGGYQRVGTVCEHGSTFPQQTSIWTKANDRQSRAHLGNPRDCLDQYSAFGRQCDPGIDADEHQAQHAEQKTQPGAVAGGREDGAKNTETDCARTSK